MPDEIIEKSFKCDECPRSFASEGGLKRHKFAHERKRNADQPGEIPQLDLDAEYTPAQCEAFILKTPKQLIEYIRRGTNYCGNCGYPLHKS